MKIKLKKIIPLIVLLVIGSFYMISCDEEKPTGYGLSHTSTKSDPDHTILLKGYYHPSGYFTPYTSLCTTCHGADLTGDPGGGGFLPTPSCYSCHGENWTESPVSPPSFNPPSDHTIVIRGWEHKTNPDTPYTSLCTDCHGSDLKGGGSGEPSCYLCHGKLWTENPGDGISFDPPSDHTVSRYGRMHKPLFDNNPYQYNTTATDPSQSSACTVCHGADLEGGVLWNGKTPPSCNLCHGQKWSATPEAPPSFSPHASDHTDSKRARMHKRDADTPYQVNRKATSVTGSSACFACHGNNLTGNIGAAPSCYTCHGQRWTGSWPPDDTLTMNTTSDHTININSYGHNHRAMNSGGTVSPSDSPWGGLTPLPGPLGAPGFGYCAVCHSETNKDLTGGALEREKEPPSCYTCHGQRWSGGDTGDLSDNFCSEEMMCNHSGTYFRGRNHRSGYTNPTSHCTNCHGRDLKGSNSNGGGGRGKGGGGKGARPSCYACHGEEWNNR